MKSWPKGAADLEGENRAYRGAIRLQFFNESIGSMTKPSHPAPNYELNRWR